MKKYALILMMAAVISGCSNEKNVTIKGTFTEEKEGTVYLDKSEVDHSMVIDSTTIKRDRFKFKVDITGPEFYQVRLDNGEFVDLLVMPGEKVDLTLGQSPVAMNYTISGSPGSDDLKMLDQHLLKTKTELDSIRNIYSSLDANELAVRGPELEKAFAGLVDAQRKFNIKFIIENINSMASIQALYQRIDNDTYVLYQQRDLQYLKIVSDSLSVKYPVSRHVRALKENVTNELNRMYLNRMASLAAQMPLTNTKPDLPDMDGKKISVESLKGKYVLVSFWSTLSQNCMNELPALKSIYTEYHKKGLEIYQVNLDPDPERWKYYVSYEELPWICVREEDPQHPVYTKLLNITSVPANILYDPEGNLINTNLFGRNLQIRMDQLFNKQ